MKKLVVILLLFGAFIEQSQAKIQAGVGITVGPCLARWNNEFLHAKLSSAGGTLGYMPGVHAGIQGRIWFNKFVGINLGVEFNMGGTKFDRYVSNNNQNVISLRHKENQLTIPLTAMVGWGNERLRIFFNGGGYFGYILSAKDTYKQTNAGVTQVSYTTGADFSSDTGYQHIDLGVVVGGGVQIYVDKKLKQCITFDINYQFGLYKVFKGDHTPGYFNEPQKVHLTPAKFLIGVGYLYTFGKSQAEEKPKRDY